MKLTESKLSQIFMSIKMTYYFATFYDKTSAMYLNWSQRARQYTINSSHVINKALFGGTQLQGGTISVEPR